MEETVTSKLALVKDIVDSSLTAVAAMDDKGWTKKEKHRNRSSTFVKEIADAFRNKYPDKDGYRVLSRACESDKKEFKVNELLFDITVCSVHSTSSKKRDIDLIYLGDVEWIIESELEDGNYREPLTDFNKFVLGNSKNKLFVGSTRNDNPFLLETLSKPAQYCNGDIFTAIVPHPRTWKITTPKADIYSYEYTTCKWIKL